MCQALCVLVKKIKVNVLVVVNKHLLYYAPCWIWINVENIVLPLNTYVDIILVLEH